MIVFVWLLINISPSNIFQKMLWLSEENQQTFFLGVEIVVVDRSIKTAVYLALKVKREVKQWAWAVVDIHFFTIQ